VQILVTGGAGYIGAHVVRLLRGRGDSVVVVDDLAAGIAARLDGLSVTQMDLSTDQAANELEVLIREHEVEAVVHFAARKQVAESVARPAWYFQQNIGSLANVLLAMERAAVSRFVFSSSAAVYGSTEGAAISETDPTVPINPYGETKLVCEKLITAATRAFDLRATSLRYFNVAGAGWPELGDNAVSNLVPMVFERVDAGDPPLIFGNDYATPDGTCIRDYVHVLDLADAHVASLDRLAGDADGHAVFNVGTGTGTSVREMINAIALVAGVSVEPRILPRRVGDPARVVASVRKIEMLLGWHARRGIEEIVASAWKAHRSSGLQQH
jgi:UDP-glucose 4-epimerase